jgi:SAM-dependent methyltransferase
MISLIDGPFSNVSKKQRAGLTALDYKLKAGQYRLESFDCLCGSYKEILIAGKDRYALDFPTIGCPECGLLRTSPNLDADSLRQFYKNEYREIYSPTKKGIEKHFEAQLHAGTKILSALGSFMNDAYKSVLDYGCGAGGVLKQFKEAGFDTLGIDLNEGYLKKAREEGLNVSNSDFVIDSSRSSFDIVILSHVLEHTPNPLGTLSRLRDILTDNGVIYVEVPGILNIKNLYSHPQFYFQQAHYWHFSRASLQNILNFSGFCPLEIDERVVSISKKSEKQPLKRDSELIQKIVARIQG